MTDDRDAPVHDASRDDVSLLRGTPAQARARARERARARRRHAWSPEPTTEEGRRRRRRARWATAGIVVLGVALEFGRGVLRHRQHEQDRRPTYTAALDLIPILHVTSGWADDTRALVFTTSTGEGSFPFGGSDAVRFVLALPADDAEIERTVDAIVADLVRRGAGPPVSWPSGLDRDDDRALADRVIGRVRARSSGHAAR